MNKNKLTYKKLKYSKQIQKEKQEQKQKTQN